jgi:hypothetical protein
VKTIEVFALNRFGRFISLSVASLLLCLTLAGCGGDSPWRYSPGVPKTPTALTAIPGNGQVSLSWTPATGATSASIFYNIYYGTAPVSAQGGNVTKIARVSGSSTIVTGLSNNVTYYFAVTAETSSGESPFSDQTVVAPSVPGVFLQSNLEGTWYFNALVSGPEARWMRGSATIDSTGKVVIASFLDSAGNSVAPAGVLGTFTVQPDGSVSQQDLASTFHGTLSENQFRDTLVGTATFGSSRLLAILQKRVPGITYTASDIKGTGKLVAGPLDYVYHQLSSGVNKEWEVASCQVGQDQSVTYLAINAPSTRQLPGAGNKVSTLSITADGLVTETPLAGALPQPAALLSNAVMSPDKMTIVGTATDAGGAYVLRIIQLVHPPSVLLTSSSYLAADLAGTYAFHDLSAASISSWAYGKLSIDGSGVLGVTSFLDSNGSSALPTPFTLSMDQAGSLIRAGDPFYSGKLSYFKDMMVTTGTDSGGAYRLSVALKR